MRRVIAVILRDAAHLKTSAIPHDDPMGCFLFWTAPALRGWICYCWIALASLRCCWMSLAASSACFAKWTALHFSSFAASTAATFRISPNSPR